VLRLSLDDEQLLQNWRGQGGADDDARWRSFFSVLSSRVVRPSPTQRVLFVVFVVVEEKGFEYSEYDDDSERSDFGIDDAMLFVLFVFFKLEGDE
jgi:hypothetical protein